MLKYKICVTTSLQAPARAKYLGKENYSMSVYELEHKLDEALESHKQELNFISSGEAPLSREEILQLA